MDVNLTAALGVFMRWLHIVSVITIIGGFIFARFMVAPALAALTPSAAGAFSTGMISRFRPILYGAIGAVLLSGLYNYLTKPFYPPHYHAVIGVKFLLVLHVFAASVLYTIPNAAEASRVRKLNSILISGVLIVLISAVLRYLTLAPGLVK